MPNKKPFLDQSLFYLNLTGLNPQNQNFFSKIRAVFAILSTGLLTLLLIMEIIINWRGIDSLLAGASSVAAYGQMVIQMVLIMRALNIIDQMIKEVNEFWSLENINADVLREIESDHKFVKRLLKLIQICYLFAIAAYFIQPLFIKIRKFPIQFYQPVDLLVSPRYEISYLLLFLNALFAVPFLIGFDMIYISIILHVISELRIIKYGFENLDINEKTTGDDSKCLDKFGMLIEHHCFILNIIKLLNDTYSVVMLCIFVFTIFCNCLGLFTLTGQGFPPPLDVLAQCAIFLFCSSGELLIYCTGGTVIKEESASVARAVYNCKWYGKTQSKLRKCVVMVLRRSLYGDQIAVGGMFELNLESFTNVMKTGMSFYTLMNAVYIEE